MTSRSRGSMKLTAALALFASAWFACPDAGAVSYHVVFCGSGGEEEFSERFRDWGTRLRDALVMRLGIPTDNVILLTEPETANAPSYATTNLESIRGVLEAMAEQVTPDDDLFVYFIGHGSYFKNTSKFHIPGADLTAGELNLLLGEISARRIAILNSTSGSAGFINVLSGADRVICSATKSVSEVNATEFMGFFIEGLEDGSGDRDHDERISFLEACEQAAELTASWYMSEGLLATEHAILDDNGDGLGSRLPIEIIVTSSGDEKEAIESDELLDGLLASIFYIKDYRFHPDVPQDLVDVYLATLEEVEWLKADKLEQSEEAYFAELERLLLKAAYANREIRSYGAALSVDS